MFLNLNRFYGKLSPANIRRPTQKIKEQINFLRAHKTFFKLRPCLLGVFKDGSNRFCFSLFSAPVFQNRHILFKKRSFFECHENKKYINTDRNRRKNGSSNEIF